jgi:hypothetical protein
MFESTHQQFAHSPYPFYYKAQYLNPVSNISSLLQQQSRLSQTDNSMAHSATFAILLICSGNQRDFLQNFTTASEFTEQSNHRAKTELVFPNCVCEQMYSAAKIRAFHNNRK